jgi:putative heme-binding domain-containing protein
MNARSLFILFALTAAVRAQTPQWIWHSQTNAQTVYFRKTFRTPPLTWNARLTVATDDRGEIFLNGVSVGTCSDWRQPMRNELSVRLNQGENVIAVKGENGSGPGGLLVHFNVNGQTNIVSDSSWLTSPNEETGWSTLAFNAAHWAHASVVAEHGAQPWGDVLFRGSATPAESLKVADGFRVELLRSAEPGEGSWICMTFDHRGRLIVSPQGDERPLLRLSFSGGKVANVEKLSAPMHYAMGLLYAFDSLYVNGHGPNGTGLYRLIDENKDDQFETNEIHLLKVFRGESEHGYHALALGPDKKIYVLNGNGTRLPEGISSNSPYRNYAEDSLSGGLGIDESQDGAKAPACHVLQSDAEGREWKLWAGGMRNAYDMDFNADGELFTFDSDMEWDWGTPWYRPTRILHLVSGGEYGWRDGTRMWADYYPDALPPVTYIGIGSPTGVKFGTRSNFPEKYRRALYVADWSYGRILAVHLTPTNSTYRGETEAFIQGTPLNLTSLTFGPDGSMYFITGGRGTQSGLYRVSYSGTPLARDKREEDSAVSARKVRHALENFHTQPANDAQLTALQSQLFSPDRWLQYAARVALEHQDPARWVPQKLASDPSLDELLPVVRVDPKANELLSSHLVKGRGFQATVPNLRLLEVLMSHSDLSTDLRQRIAQRLDRQFPARTWEVNRELSRVLLHLGSTQGVSKCVRLLQSAKTQEEQLHYIEQLRNIREGWSLTDRKIFFSWFLKPRDPQAHPPEILQYFKDVGRSYVDGAWFDRYLRDFRRQAAATLTDEERRELAPLLNAPVSPAQNIPANNRQFVREWKMEDFGEVLQKTSAPNLPRGRQALVDAQCLTCHRFGNDGGIVGPELTGAGAKYNARDLLESILEPSKVLSDQYQDHTAILKEGDTISGRLVAESDKEIILETDRLSGATEKIAREKVANVTPSKLSPMPAGLANVLTKEEILDLIAYLRTPITAGK